MRRPTLLLVAGLVAALTPFAGSSHVVDARNSARFPTTIELPDGFFPEGITIDRRTAYVGSLIDGSIQMQDLRTGRSTEFAGSPGPSRIAVGMDVDRHQRLWVAGGGPVLDPTVAAGFRVYDIRTGDLVSDVTLPAAGFLNDVIVTRDAAWFTDSFAPHLIRVPIASDGTIGEPEFASLGGDWQQAAGFNANGIAATGDERHLIVAQSTAPDGPGAALYRVPASRDATALDATRIPLDGELGGADGLVLVGRTLYVVAGAEGVVEVRLARSLGAGRVVDTLTVPDSVTPTTADVFGSRLYVVDAKFPFLGDPTTSFQTTAIRR